jgi:hypothetical protein
MSTNASMLMRALKRKLKWLQASRFFLTMCNLSETNEEQYLKDIYVNFSLRFLERFYYTDLSADLRSVSICGV